MAARNMIARKTVRGKVTSQQDRALIVTLHVLLIRVFQLQSVILEGSWKEMIHLLYRPVFPSILSTVQVALAI